MQTKTLAKRRGKAKAIDLRKAIESSEWRTVRAFARVIGCHENTLNTACRAGTLPRNRVIREATLRALGLPIEVAP